MNIVIIRSKVAVEFFPIGYIEYIKQSGGLRTVQDGSGRVLGHTDVS